MAVDPEIGEVLKLLAGMKPMDQMSLPELRASMVPIPLEKRRPMKSVQDFATDQGIKLRRYEPEQASGDKSIVFFHGGGFVLGDLDTHDHLCRDLAAACRCIVVAVDYRRAPEFRFPIPVDDCLHALTWIMDNREALKLPGDRIVLAGDSAGGTLSTVTALRWRDSGKTPLAGQILGYPVTDYHTPARPSYMENAEGYSLTRNAMLRFWADYVISPEQARHPWASPLMAEDLSGLPPALVITAQYDPLRDEGDAYAQKLAENGVQVTHLKYDGLIHGFLRMSLVSQRARDAFVDISKWFAAL